MFRFARLLSIVALFALALSLAALPGAAQATNRPPATPIFVDTDIGVDDAVAIAWLLEQRNAEVVGFSTVFGNTSVENATRNLLTLLDAADASSLPVTIGASDPLVLPRTRTGAFVHGPDGLWFGQQPAEISSLPTNGAAALVAAAQARPGLIIVALGPLTNIANAISLNPTAMASAKIIALGGGTRGNRTPVAEFNIFADPDALDMVLESGVQIELLTLDAFDGVRVDGQSFPQELAAEGGAVGQLLATILGPYIQVQTGGGPGTAAIPDAAAVIYALRPELATVQPALVKVITEEGLTRGLTIIGTTLNARIPMIANDAEISSLADQAFTPGFDLNSALFGILLREPDNAKVILTLRGNIMARTLERGLTR